MITINSKQYDPETNGYYIHVTIEKNKIIRSGTEFIPSEKIEVNEDDFLILQLEKLYS